MKLAVFDFDSTLMDGETIDFLADELGIGEEVAKITEEAKEETDPAKKARLEAEIILITNEANKLESRIKSVNSGFERNVQKGHESIFSLHIDKPDTAALIGAETVDELVRKDLTPQFMGTVLDLLSKSLAKELKGFKDIHDTGASEFISSTLYTESSEVYGIDVPAELFRGPLTRPSEQLDCLLTDDELDRLSSLAGVMSKLYYPSEYVSPVELINTMIEGQRQARRFVEKFHSNSVVTHATTERGALAILRDGHLRSEVGVKSNSSHENNQIVANSAQGYIIENTTISFSVDDVESQFLETYNPDNEPIQERNGVIFARRTSEMCHDTAWFLMTNTQTTSRSEALELQVLDEDGVDIKEMDMFVSLEDFDYWTSQLEEIGYSTEWIKAHVHPIDFELDKYEQIVSELPKGATSSDESLPYKAGIYKDVRRRPRSSLLSSGTIKIDESAPEIVIPTTVYRL